ncbi:AAA family ATPase [Paratractidigestivibacter sp.]|uniref:AAA family ATPase n=1 Tax=Paratractidigestivibacter sp. TaxID=2847316 RepID=UPI002ACB0FBF|nr:AAA family ATPase [Paratractidigestivibacter sp.]
MFDTQSAVSNFSTLSTNAQEALSKAMGSIDSGVAPDEDLITEVNGSLKSLRTAYDAIKAAAAELPDALGDGDLPVETYAGAFAAAEARKAREATRGVVELLERFVRVTSDDETFANALAGSQKEAAETLELIKSKPEDGGVLALCDDEKVTRSRKAFFEAMEYEDLSDEKGLELIDEISTYYPKRVEQGLMFQKYYLPTEASGPKTTAVAAQPSNGQTEEPEASAIPVTPKTPDTNAVPSPIFGSRKKLGVKAFLGDVFNGDTLYARVISLIALWPGLTHEQVIPATYLGTTDDPDDAAVSSVIKKLEKRGYVERVGSTDGIARLTLSAETRKLFAKPTVYAAKSRGGQHLHWPLPLPSEGKRPSIEDRHTAFVTTPPEVVTRKYDLLIELLGKCEKHEVGRAEAGFNRAIKCSIDSMFTKVGRKRINCELYVVGQEELPSSDSVLSSISIPNEAKGRGYAHWFTLRDGELVDDLADDDATDDNDVKPHSAPDTADAAAAVTPTSTSAEDVAESGDSPEEEAETHSVDTVEIPSPSDGTSDAEEEDRAILESAAPVDYESLDSRELASALSERRVAPTDGEVQQLIEKLFDETSDEDAGTALAFCLAFLKSVTFDGNHPSAATGIKQLALACDSKIAPHSYTGSELATAFKRVDDGTNVLLLASCCQAMLAPKNPYDYELNAFCASYMNAFDEVFSDLAVAKPLFNELQKVRDISPDKGLSRSVVAALGSERDRATKLGEVRERAKALRSTPTFKAKITGLGEFGELCFGKSSELGKCMEIVSELRRDDSPYVRNVLDKYRSDGDSASDKKVNEVIDENFQVARSNNEKSGRMKLIADARKKAVESYRDRLDTMAEWLELVEVPVDGEVLTNLATLRNDLIAIIDETEDSGHALKSKFDRFVLSALLKSLKGKLVGVPATIERYDTFATTGFVSVIDGLPVLAPQLAAIVYCEPWRAVLKHRAHEPVDPHTAAKLTLQEGSDNLDNIGQLKELISTFGPFEDIDAPSKDDLRRAQASGEEELKRFNDDLEMAYAYNKIDEIQKERLSEAAMINKDRFFELEDFANWRRFLNGLERQVNDYAASQRDSLRDRLASCEEKLAGAPSGLIAAAKKLFEDENYAVVEEYLNRFEAGEREVDPVYESQKDEFSDFISDEVYGTIYSHCAAASSRTMSRVTTDYIKAHKPDGRSQDSNESAKALVSHWPVRNAKTDTVANDIVALLKGIGIDAQKAEQKAVRRYRVTVRPTDRNREQYEHPIAAFGTMMPETIDVLVHFGQPTPSEIVQAVTKQDMTAMSIVIVDAPMRLEDKRQLAERFHTEQLSMQFIIIDRVLALHLALHERAERLSLALKCSLPFTYYQPFVRDGGPTPDEMFCGRSSELGSVTSPNGACVVYGGRQLGKTALLQRAESLVHKPDNKSYAVYVSILNFHTEKAVAGAIADKLKQKTGFDLGDVNSIGQLCGKISELMRNGKVSRMLLLIDECDNFLDAISGSAYKQIQPLVDLRGETRNSFKFVIAGLHNVCRAKNATENNGIFGQLGSPICIKPFSPREALQLISRPLMFLGFQVDRYPHLETILTNTNYYPGIIQFFGHILVETMKRQYGDYYRAADGNPPYQLNEKQLGAILNEADLNRSIREKFRLSLELDNRYFMLARCIALLYYDSEREDDQAPLLTGFSAESIRGSAGELGIACIADEDMKTVLQLLDEMVEMGILSKPDPEDRNYKLRRRSFLNAIGTSEDAILNDIIGESD